MNRATFAILLAACVLSACRGREHSHTPIHLNLNMDYQERFDPQEANPFFADNRSMRPLVPGTVARGALRDDAPLYEGRNEDGSYVSDLPVPVTRALLERGQARYDIFCTPCHGGAGDGEGIITTGNFGFTPAPTFHSDRLREIEDGYLYSVIANGVRTMPPYGHQIPVADRWAIVSYVRALQRSQYAEEGDVPPSIRTELSRRGASALSPSDEPGGEDGEAAPAEGENGSADTTAQGAGDNE